MTRATDIVYLDTGRMLLRPPGRIAFHRKGRSEWPRYIPDPTSTWAAMLDPENDRERHWTACGLTTYDSRYHRKTIIPGVRRDNAELIGVPCRRCWEATA
uniref:Uncharacterized protein n=1 Tax=viral metagenome TaxID=1070528 RepID=A0A6M3L4I1_9ZZZZ